jgi:hypothetical protein
MISGATAARNRSTGLIIGGAAFGLAFCTYLYVRSSRGPVRAWSFRRLQHAAQKMGYNRAPIDDGSMALNCELSLHEFLSVGG